SAATHTQDPVRLPAQRVVVDERQQVAARITDLGPPHPSPAGCDTLAEPERAQRRDCVCRDDQPESRLVELRHLLDYGRLDAGALECDRHSEPTYPGSDDHRAHVSSLRGVTANETSCETPPPGNLAEHGP